jgi:hypothetical protein
MLSLLTLRKGQCMNTSHENRRASTSRRDFLKHTGSALAGAALLNAINVRSYAAEDNTIKIALIGCGGRGTGAAANALATQGPVKLVAMADVFPDRLESSLKNLASSFGDKVDVPKERQFLGMDAYQKALAEIAPGGVALLTTPPAFRPLHFERAVAADCHVFMEKSFAVDAPGVRRVLKTGEEATKRNLKVAGGLMSRHYKPLENRRTNPSGSDRRRHHLLGLPRAWSGGLSAQSARMERDGAPDSQLLVLYLGQR